MKWDYNRPYTDLVLTNIITYMGTDKDDNRVIYLKDRRVKKWVEVKYIDNEITNTGVFDKVPLEYQRCECTPKAVKYLLEGE